VRILHLFSNWKWTGPAEPAVNLAASLSDLGHEVELACGRTPRGNRSFLAERAREVGLEPLSGFRLRKHRSLVDDFRDVRTLRRKFREECPDILHVHLDNDHRIARRAMVGREAAPLLVRSVYAGDREELGALDVLAPSARMLLCVSSRVAEELPARCGVERERVLHLEGAVDLDRFSSDDDVPRLQDEPTVGVVARMQTHRRFELLLEAFRRVVERLPTARLHVIGRGTNQKTVAEEPARRLGIEDKVRFLGYVPGDEYVRALRRLRTLVYLVPGSDGSCRTVREALACGVPVVCSRRGILTELVREGETGFAVEEDPAELARALLRVLDDSLLQRRMSRAAAEDARKRFSLEEQARRVETIYKELLGNAAPKTAGGAAKARGR
jgi:glycosyltransferase involved in cell wall biosynthesis